MSPIATRRRVSSPASAFSPCSRAAAIRVADLVGDAGGDAPQPSQALRLGGAGRRCRGFALRLGEAPSRVIERIDELVELALSGARDERHAFRTGAAERRLDVRDVTAPEHENTADPGRHADHQGEQHPEPEAERVETLHGVDARHRPGGEPGYGSAERTGMQQQGLRPGDEALIGRLLVARGLQVDRLNAASFRLGQIGFRAGSLVGREGIGEGACSQLPDTALHAGLALQRDPDQAGEISPCTRVEAPGSRTCPGRGIEPPAIDDQVTGMRDDRLGAADLRS
ncbi:MAG: hypothetical protein JO157_02500 [Acetobacteraceae bacterium]|nr:hypothetical protein [Acetobacteraceae bacterium]